MINKDQLVVIMCPPYPEYKEQPKDQSHCELFDCPKCKGKMWLSEKKKGVLMFAASAMCDILLGCYDCIKKEIGKDPAFFAEHERVDL